MYGIDISNYQRAIDLSKGNYDFAIIKATEGFGFEDKSFKNYTSQLTKLGKLIGCYHFARPDLNGSISEMTKEASWFVKKVKEAELLGKAILILDWETQPMEREDLINAWIETVQSETGVIPFVYMSKSYAIKMKGYSFMQTCPIWVAQWPFSAPKQVGEEIDLSMATKEFKWHIWQYTSVGKYPSLPGNIDLNYTSMTAEDWECWAWHKKVEKEVITEDMKWAIEMGLFSGHTDGTYRPKDPLTREQAASLLRKLYNILYFA